MSEQLERAGRVIAELRRKLAELSSGSADPVAIIGMACRFPGRAHDLDSFWEMIRNGETAVRDAGESSTDGRRPSAKLDDVASFDPGFFDISPREALQMDPQQRLFLEVAWNALEDAGQTKGELAGSETATFVGVNNFSDGYYQLQKSIGAINELSGVGGSHDVIAGRLAYFLDLHGPSAAVNTACSSSLLAFHFACQSLIAGDCRTAVVGGVNLLSGSAESILADAGMLSPDGRCKTFDSRADGFGRGEGCGVVVLKRHSHARADRDRVLAVVRATAVNQDGRTNGLNAPSGLAQQALLRRALAKSGLRAADITYVEAHGTGTSLGDPIEVEAIAEVYGAPDPQSPPCALGAAKANINHLEGAAGIAGIIKAVLALRARTIPPVAGLEQLNEHLSLEGTRLVVPRAATPWETGGSPRFVGVSSFGWSGLNAHAILEEAPAEDERAPRPVRPVIVVASAADPRSLPERLESLAARLAELPDASLEDFAWTAARRRSHFEHRAAVAGSNRLAVVDALRVRAAECRAETRAVEPATASSLDAGMQELRANAQRYEAGSDVDWDAAYAANARLISLPAYPFRKRRFWVADGIGSTQRAATPSFTPVAPDDWFYEAAWERSDAAAQVGRSSFDRWLILADRGGIANAFADAARAAGDTVRVVGDLDVFTELFADLAAAERRTAIVDLRAVDVRPDEISAEALRLANATLGLHAAIAAHAWLRPPALFVVTRGAQSPLPLEPPSAPAAASLWGLVRCLRLEHPEFWGGLVDLGAQPCAGDVQALFAELRATDGDTETALHAGQRFVARLRQASAPSAARVALRGDATYLLTGAFGVVGSRFARWLADHDARHLVLVGRTSASGDVAERLRADLMACGVTVRLESCDIGDAAQVEAMWSRIGAELPAVRGIFHAAGMAELSETRNAADLAAAFHAKLGGTLAFDRASSAAPLDFFVCFSSIAAIIGDPTWPRRRAGYAAANAAMDAIVAGRRARGLPGLSIDWGLWGGRDQSSLQPLIMSGLDVMPLEAGFDALWRLLGEGGSRVDRQPVVAALDVRKLADALGLRGRKALLSAFDGTTADATPAIASPIADEIRRSAPHERERLLVAAVARDVRAELQLTDDDRLDFDRGFFDLGMDSLMTIALKTRLERTFGLNMPSTLTLEYPSVSALCTYLTGVLSGEPAGAPASAPQFEARFGGAHQPAAGSREPDATLADVDDRDVASALAAELRELDLELL
jgi:acyl transferase domain-containing protein/acyl carrier protein